eukprot:364087-Chlamydomonas_euryale.AAC.5
MPSVHIRNVIDVSDTKCQGSFSLWRFWYDSAGITGAPYQRWHGKAKDCRTCVLFQGMHASEAYICTYAYMLLQQSGHANAAVPPGWRQLQFMT